MAVIDRYEETYRAWRWQVPARFNIAEVCCRRHVGADRVALYWEDEAGATARYTFDRLQADANRLANALAALGVARGDRIAIVLPQRPETVIAHLACYQLGAVAMPLSVLFGPDALEYRLQNSEAVVAIVDPQSIEAIAEIAPRTPSLGHVIGVAGARSAASHDFEALLARAADSFTPAGTGPRDPAVLVYTSGTTGPPKGALMPHQALIGNLPGFVYSHDDFPQGDDLFWSPADWAWTGGLMDALLPTLYFGRTIVGYRGRFDPERAFDLIARHRVRNTFLFPTALKMMMKSVPDPRRDYAVALRTIMSGGESLGETVFDWCASALGVTVNEIFGQTEVNYIVGNCATRWPALGGSMGRPYPGHRVAVIDDDGRPLSAGEVGEVAVHRQDIHGDDDPVFFLGYWKNEGATAAKYSGAWCRTGDLARADERGYLWYQGRADDMFKSAGYRIGPSEIENCLVQHAAVANAAVIGKPDAARGAIVKAFVVLQPGVAPGAALEAALKEHVRGRLAPYEYPKEIEFIDSLPMTTTGKVQRRVLREREAARSRDSTTDRGNRA